MDETKSWYFEKINKIDKSLTRLIKKKERTQINKIGNEREIVTDTIEIKRLQEITMGGEVGEGHCLKNGEEIIKEHI